MPLKDSPWAVEAGEVGSNATKEQELRQDLRIQGPKQTHGCLWEGAGIPLHQRPGWKSSACVWASPVGEEPGH